jgi:hypothetical protein
LLNPVQTGEPAPASKPAGQVVLLTTDGRSIYLSVPVAVDALTEQLPRCLTASVYTVTVARVRQLVDGLDAETCLAWAHAIAPDPVPSFEAWARPERPG